MDFLDYTQKGTYVEVPGNTWVVEKHLKPKLPVLGISGVSVTAMKPILLLSFAITNSNHFQCHRRTFSLPFAKVSCHGEHKSMTWGVSSVSSSLVSPVAPKSEAADSFSDAKPSLM